MCLSPGVRAPHESVCFTFPAVCFVSQYGARFDKGETAVEIARRERLYSPCLLLKFLLPLHRNIPKPTVAAGSARVS